MIDSDLLSMADCSSYETAENISLTDSGRCDALLISKDEYRGADMIGDDAN